MTLREKKKNKDNTPLFDWASSIFPTSWDAGYLATKPISTDKVKEKKSPSKKSAKYPANFHPLIDWSGTNSFSIQNFCKTQNHFIQKTFFSIFDPQNIPAKLDLTPPIEIDTSPKKRKPRKVRTSTTYFDQMHGEEKEVKVHQAPHPEFKDLKIWKNDTKITEVTASNGKQITVPESLEEAVERFNLQAMNLDVPAFIHEQIRALTVSKVVKDNLFLTADTSFGKTFVEAMIAISEVAEDGRPIIFTTREELTEQIKEQILLFFDVPEESIAAISGHLDLEKRKALYHDPRVKITVSTPEVLYNDILSKNVATKDFTMAIFDEGHKGVGNTKYLATGKLFYKAGLPLRLFSATLPDKDHRLIEMLDGFGIRRERIYKFFSDEKAIFPARHLHIVKDPVILAASRSLYNQIGATALSFYRSLLAAARTPDGYYTDTVQAIVAFEKATSIHKGKLNLPSEEQKAKISDLLKIARTNREDDFKEISSLWSELGYRSYAYELLTRFGKYAFLHYVGNDIYAHRFNVKRRSGKGKGLFFSNVFEKIDKGSELAKTYNSIADGTPYALLVNTNSFTPLAEALRVAGRLPQNTTQKPEPLKNAFFSYASSCVINDPDWYDGSITERMVQLVRRHAAFGRADQILIYTENSDTAMFYSALLERVLKPTGTKAVPFTGTKTMKRVDRKENLRMFKYGEAGILIGTSSIREGLDSKASVLIKCNHDPNSDAIKQLLGRVGRGKGAVGIVYNEITLGTPDYPRFIAGWKRLKKQRGLARSS